MADETPRPGYRGKCLYKTGKCNNERALKTSGQAHNLCDEHRHRQNEHQRKLDAKNRFARKDKRAGKDESPTSAMARAGHRYVPYGKVRMSPGAAAAVSAVSAVSAVPGVPSPDDVHAILGRNGIVATSAMNQSMMQLHALGVEGANAMAAAAAQMVGANMASATPEVLPSGVVILPNGPQAPQMPYPSAMQDFDGIVVPLPSYLEGHERVEFRSRIYQKVLDFIAEECMRRFGAVAPTGKAPDGLVPQQPPPVGERREEAVEIPVVDDDKVPTAHQAPDGHQTSSDPKAPLGSESNDKDVDETQPEDREDLAVDEGDEETPRSKRATRSRVVRKEGQVI